MIRSRTRRKPGYSLLEMLVSITLTSMVFSGMAVALHVVFRTHTELRESVADAARLPRLDRQLRQDAHRAVSAEKTESGIELQAPGERIVYASDERRILRQVFVGDQQRHQEQYLLREGTQMQWEVRDSMLFLRLTTPNGREVPTDTRQRLLSAAVNLANRSPAGPLEIEE